MSDANPILGYYKVDRSNYGLKIGVIVSIVLHVLGLGGLVVLSQTAEERFKPTNAMTVQLAGRPAASSGKKSKAPVAGRTRNKPKTQKKAPKPKPKAPAKKRVAKPTDVGLNRDKPKKKKTAEKKPKTSTESNAKQSRRKPDPKPAPVEQPKDKAPIARGGFGGEDKSGLSFEVGNSEQVDTSDMEWQAYYRNVYTQVSRAWSRGSVRAGVTRVRFHIRKDGSIEGIDVVMTSGRSYLDSRAKRAVQRVEGLPPLPQGFRGDRLIINIDFDYTNE